MQDDRDTVSSREATGVKTDGGGTYVDGQGVTHIPVKLRAFEFTAHVARISALPVEVLTV